MLNSNEVMNIINNPNPTGIISSCIICINDIGAGKQRKVIKIKKNNQTEYELIFEKDIITAYTKDKHDSMVANEIEKINCHKKINNEEIECLLSFICHSKQSMEIFNEYLKYNVKLKKENFINEKNNIKEKIEYEEINDIVYDNIGEVKAVSITAHEENGVYEKHISIRQNETWKNVYYGSFDKDGIILEMTVGLSYLEIEQMRNVLNKKPKLLNEFDKCIKTEKEQNQLIKKY